MCAAPPAPAPLARSSHFPPKYGVGKLSLPTTPRLAWQYAHVFNQPLAWDVSSVTSMNRMFSVQSAACLRIACLTPPATQDPCRLSLPTTPRLAWQYATRFNQPLAWNVSSVTNMDRMFQVRSATYLCTVPKATATASPSTTRKTHLASHFPPHLASPGSMHPVSISHLLGTSRA